jgi:hypothetical protein
MPLHEDDFLSSTCLQDIQDLVARRSVELKKKDHVPLDEREIWWALEATLRLLNEATNKQVMI